MGSWIWWLANIWKYMFGGVELVKNVDIDKYKYYWYSNGFDRPGTFSVANGFGNT